MNHRQQIYRSQRERLETLYLDSQRRGRGDVVLFVLDLTDPSAAGLAAALSSPEEVAGQVAEAKRRGVGPLVVTDQTVEGAKSLLRDRPTSLEGIELCLARKQVPIAIMGDGGISLTGMPPPLDDDRAEEQP